MNTLDSLIQQFEKFPGVGARQAKRFAFHILRMPQADTERLAQLINDLRGTVSECSRCHRYFPAQSATDVICGICNDPNRDHSKLLVVASDNDITPIERSGVYDGLYFVLGGMVPLLDDHSTNRLRGQALRAAVEAAQGEGLSEIILGFAVSPDGENTGRYVQQLLKESLSTGTIKVSELGRGLSTGSELEYADPETIKNAVVNRH